MEWTKKTITLMSCLFKALYTDISCGGGGVFAENTSREAKNFPSRMVWEIYLKTGILQIPWKKAKSYANTWSKYSVNSQCKAWICQKYNGY
jgi:hypothetical protein